MSESHSTSARYRRTLCGILWLTLAFPADAACAQTQPSPDVEVRVAELCEQRRLAALKRDGIFYEFHFRWSGIDAAAIDIRAQYATRAGGAFYARYLDPKGGLELAFDGSEGDVRETRGLRVRQSKDFVGKPFGLDQILNCGTSAETIKAMRGKGTAEFRSASIGRWHEGRSLTLTGKYRNPRGEFDFEDTYALDKDGWLVASVVRDAGGKVQDEFVVSEIGRFACDGVGVCLPISCARTRYRTAGATPDQPVMRMSMEIAPASVRAIDATDKFRLLPRKGEKVYLDFRRVDAGVAGPNRPRSGVAARIVDDRGSPGLLWKVTGIVAACVALVCVTLLWARRNRRAARH